MRVWWAQTLRPRPRVSVHAWLRALHVALAHARLGGAGYASDEQVHVLGQQLHKLCNAISQPTQLPAVPDTMTPEAFISAFKAYMGAVNQCFDDALDVAIKSGRTGRELLMTVNTEVMGSAARESQEAVLREHGLTEPVRACGLRCAVQRSIAVSPSCCSLVLSAACLAVVPSRAAQVPGPRRSEDAA